MNSLMAPVDMLGSERSNEMSISVDKYTIQPHDASAGGKSFFYASSKEPSILIL